MPESSFVNLRLLNESGEKKRKMYPLLMKK